MRLAIITSVDSKYEDFVPLFVASHLAYNKDASCFVLVMNVEEAKGNPHLNYNALKKLYGARFELHAYDSDRCNASKARFCFADRNILSHFEFLYITDADIICCEAIAQHHEKIINSHGINYSNITRKEKSQNDERLTGLHFCKVADWLSLDRTSKILSDITHDERFLYKLYELNSKLNEGPVTSRPVHGIHVSLNRHIYGIPTSPVYRIQSELNEKKFHLHDNYWQGIENKSFMETFLRFHNSQEFVSLQRALSIRIQFIIIALLSIADQDSKSLEGVINSCLLMQKQNKFIIRFLRFVRGIL